LLWPGSTGCTIDFTVGDRVGIPGLLVLLFATVKKILYCTTVARDLTVYH
jgi:hypothetical protein